MNLLRVVAIGLGLVGSSATTFAAPAECIKIQNNYTYQVTISPNNNFGQCFVLTSFAGDDLGLAVVSKDNVRMQADFSSLVNGSLSKFASFVVANGSSGTFETVSVSSDTYFSFRPLSKTTTSKDLELMLVRSEGKNVLLVNVYDGKEKKTQTPPPNGGNCSYVRGQLICTDPQSLPNEPGKASRVKIPKLLGGHSMSPMAACTLGQTPPPGKPSNMKVNEHLAKFSRMKGFPSWAKGPMMIWHFAPRQTYDLKNNDTYKSKSSSPAELATFGNWFYGAAAAAAGYTLDETLRAGAIVQQFQNADKFHSFEELVQRVSEAVRAGCCDNPDDPPVISDGYSYGSEVYSNDPSRDSKSDSCDPNPTSTTTGGVTEGPAGSGYEGRWSNPAPVMTVVGNAAAVRDKTPSVEVICCVPVTEGH